MSDLAQKSAQHIGSVVNSFLRTIERVRESRPESETRRSSGGYVKREQTIVYWEFNIDILGPRYNNIAKRRTARKVLSRKRLKIIEQAALRATRAKLPSRFRALLS